MARQVAVRALIRPPAETVLAVASGKGGTGKSSTAVNLAAALARAGLRTGLLDVDFHGPSIPTLTGTVGVRGRWDPTRLRIDPVAAHGLVMMSMGYFADPAEPMLWRGPMVHSAIVQFVRDVAWGTLDVLVLDTPPGSGDALLSTIQVLPLDGVVMVTTPQQVAISDVRKSVEAFRRHRVPVLGLVENMTVFVCEHGGRYPVFGAGGVDQLAQEFALPILGRIPLDPTVQQSGDAGTPFVLAAPQAPATAAFLAMVARVREELDTRRRMRVRRAPGRVVATPPSREGVRAAHSGR